MSINSIQVTNVASQPYTSAAVAPKTVVPTTQGTSYNDKNGPQKSAAEISLPQRDQVNVSSTVTLKNLDTVKAIEQLHSKMNTMIKGVRETNESINNIAEKITKMSTNLQYITKNFPPFPLESKERKDLLMSYSSIRQEILKMTIPTPPNPINIMIKSMWDSLIDQNGKILPSTLPEIQTNTSDKQVHNTLIQTQNTSDNLAALSSATTQALIQA